MSTGKRLCGKAAAYGRKVFGDKVSYYPVLRCGNLSLVTVTERGLGSRITQGLLGTVMVVGGAIDVAGGIGITAASEGIGMVYGSGLMIAGISGIGYGASEITEAMTDHNPVRDVIMSGNEKLY